MTVHHHFYVLGVVLGSEFKGVNKRQEEPCCPREQEETETKK